MSNKSEELKIIALIRKAIKPLATAARLEANEDIHNQLAQLTKAVDGLVKREVKEVRVKVETPSQVVEALEKVTQAQMQKSEPLPAPAKYEPHDQEAKKGTPFQYNGFVAENGDWYIQRIAKGEQRYAKGHGNYAEAWTNKKKQSYGYLDGSK